MPSVHPASRCSRIFCYFNRVRVLGIRALYDSIVHRSTDQDSKKGKNMRCTTGWSDQWPHLHRSTFHCPCQELIADSPRWVQGPLRKRVLPTRRSNSQHWYLFCNGVVASSRHLLSACVLYVVHSTGSIQSAFASVVQEAFASDR